MEFRMPVDYERLPEFRMLCLSLGEHVQPHVAHQQTHEKNVEKAAVYIWARLWVELSYAAQTTNRPGLLTRAGSELYKQSLEPLFGEGCDPLELLAGSGALKYEGEDFYCERFAKLNAHLAGNFKSKEIRGAAGSALERNKNRIAHDADVQAMLLPPEIFKKRDGSPLADTEVQRCMVVIMTIDNCLKRTGRKKGEYSEALIADAAAVCDKGSPEALRGFYVWLATNREHPRLPKTTEQILGDFEAIQAMSKA